MRNGTCISGDEKDVVLFSTALSDRTGKGTYDWLKNNKELIIVATSRAKDKLILLADGKELSAFIREMRMMICTSWCSM